MCRNSEEIRADLEKVKHRLEQQNFSAKIVGGGMSQFLVAEHKGRGVEIYGTEGRVTIDPAIGDELQGEIEYPSFDHAVAAASRWLNGFTLHA